MATEVVMPQMGESIAEGTIVRWIKKVGDKVDRDEPLFEISTDKVDAGIPSPAAGVVSEIRVKEGETVPVNSVVAVIGAAGAATAAKESPAPPKPSSQADGAPTPAPSAEAPPARPAAPASASAPAPAASEQSASPPARPRPVAVATPTPATSTHGTRTDYANRQRSSPLVRKIAKEHNVELSQISGSGLAGRVTKDDILAFIGQAREGTEAGQAARGAQAPSVGQPQKVASVSAAPVP